VTAYEERKEKKRQPRQQQQQPEKASRHQLCKENIVTKQKNMLGLGPLLFKAPGPVSRPFSPLKYISESISNIF